VYLIILELNSKLSYISHSIVQDSNIVGEFIVKGLTNATAIEPEKRPILA